MRNAIRYVLLGIGFLLTLALIEQPSSAQDWVGKGQGYTPMAPAEPATTEPGRQLPAVPGPPIQPSSPVRPNDWPGGGPATEASPWPRPAAVEALPAGELQPCENAKIIARVGSEAILESEVAGAVNEIIEANKDKIPASQLEKQRELLVQQRLKNLIPTKLIYLDARRQIPAEGWTQVEKQLTQHFEEVQLERMIKGAKVGSAQELDEKLRALGTSLEREKRAFIERSLAEQWGRQQVKRDDEITYTQMVTYYRENIKEFTKPAQARWEELMVSYGKHPTKEAARDAIARLGNQVLGGAPLTEVAKSGSDGFTATQGGRHDWTSKGSLASQTIDHALFSLPVGQMSPILDGDTGFHIIRVVERKEPEVTPFLEAQVEIREKIVRQRSEKQFREYLAKLEARTPVWTIYDDKPTAQLSEQPDRWLQR